MKTKHTWLVLCRSVVLVMFLALSATWAASAQELQKEHVQLERVLNPPASGTFYFVQRKNVPPFPFDPFHGALPVYSLGYAFIIDDTEVDYVALRAQQELELEQKGGGGMALMSFGAPNPGGGGGTNGGGGGSGYVGLGYNYSSNDLWLEITGLLSRLDKQYPNRVRLLAHSMGNITASEALRQQARGSQRSVIYAYVASQAASVAHAYDAVSPEIFPRIETPEVYAGYPPTRTNFFHGMAVAVAQTNGVPRVIAYHNRLDCALNGWETGQLTKPDIGWTYRWGIGRWYRGNTATLGTRLNFPANTYEIYAHIAEARSRALGAAVQGGFTVGGEISQRVDLNAAPFSYGGNGSEHSAQFRSTNMRRQSYWNRLILSFDTNP